MTKTKSKGKSKAATNGKVDKADKVDKGPARLNKAVYEAELLRMQGALVEMQEWVRGSGTRVVVVFEGRDAAGKGGALPRGAEVLNPRIGRLVAVGGSLQVVGAPGGQGLVVTARLPCREAEGGVRPAAAA